MSSRTGNETANGTNILASEEHKHRFIRSLVDIVGLYNLDGIDFFWPMDADQEANGDDDLDSRNDLIKLLEVGISPEQV